MATHTIKTDIPDAEATELLRLRASQPRGTTETFRSLQFEDFHTQRKNAHQPVFSQLSGYMGGVMPSAETSKTHKSAGLGTMLGVFLPCLQNIFGIMMFARLAWLTGTAGLIEMCAVGILCCVTTFLTTISISALATNGKVHGGGAYFIISRTLGPEIGGSIGFLFFIGNVAGCAMYIAGGVEILLMYLAPQLAIESIGPITETSSLYNHTRIYGTVALIVVFCIVSIGIKFVAVAGFVTLITVIGTIVLVFIGMFYYNDSNSKLVCSVGNRLWRMDHVYFNDAWCCTKNETCPSPNENMTSPLYQYYCRDSNSTALCQYLMDNEVGTEPAVLGLFSGLITENLWSAYATGSGEIPGSYLLEEDTIEQDPNLLKGNQKAGEIVTDMATSFLVIIGIFFPSVTGIFAGSNRSIDLADPGSAIPKGTIAAQLVTTCSYFIWIVFFAATMKGQVMRDKMGESMALSGGGSLMAGNIAWPHPKVAEIGSFLATMGASLQSLTSAPRLLNALANDDVIPFLKPFACVTKRGEPIFAQLLSAALAECCILMGSIDVIGPVVTMFFLICYSAINLSCAINSLLQTPNWRPRFRFYHWSLSLIAVVLAAIIMFMTSWWQALIAMALGLFIYKYIEFKGAQKDWGDGVRGIHMSTALAAIHHLPMEDQNVRSYRPQLLLFIKSLEDEVTGEITLQPVADYLFSFARQLKAGKGLVVVGSVVRGTYLENTAKAARVKSLILNQRDFAKLKALPCIVVAPSSQIGMATLVQSTGIGSLRPNTVVFGWPRAWQPCEENNYSMDHVHWLPTFLRVSLVADMAVVVVRYADSFPIDLKKDRMMGTIDLWWIVDDSGMLLMIPYLLQQHKVWAKTKLRIFAVNMPGQGVSNEDVRDAIKEFLYDLRIEAEVHVVEMKSGTDISAYAFQQTMTLEESIKLMNELRKSRSGPGPSSSSSTAVSPVNEPNSPSKDASRKLAEKLHSAHSLNQMIRRRSENADLIVINMPRAPKKPESDLKYMEYVKILTEDFKRVLLIRSCRKRTVVTTKFAET